MRRPGPLCQGAAPSPLPRLGGLGHGASGLSVLLAFLFLAPSPSVAEDNEGDEHPSFHLDFDLAFGLTNIRFVSPSDVVSALCTEGGACDPADFSTAVVRGAFAVGWEGMMLEATVEHPLENVALMDSVIWTVGTRVDTAPKGWLSMQVRLAYVRREGALAGEGGRVGLGLLIRPFDFGALYGEATGDITSVPAMMNEGGTLFSYSYYFGGGIRIYVGIP